MTDFDIAKWFLFGALVGGVIVHVFWNTKSRESLKTYGYFLHYLRQGYSVEQAWTRAKVTI
jgi:hypothetical protein